MEMKHKSKTRVILVLSVPIIIISVLLYLIFIPRPVKVETAVVKRGTFKNIIKADGFLRAREKYTIPAISDGDIKRVSLRVGDEVEKGEKLAEIVRDVNYLPVISPIHGIVSVVFRESAGPVRRGEPILEIVDPDNLELVTELLTTDATQVEIGDDVYGSGWGETVPIQGKVVRISKAGFIKTSALGVEEEKTEVIAEISQTPSEIKKKLGSNFHVDVVIEIEKTDNALIVPLAALFKSNFDWAVYRVEDNKAKETKIKIKSKGYEEAEVESGLNEGDKVIMFPGDLVKDGTRVKN